MATTADFKNGLCFKHKDKLVSIIEFQHVKPGKGPAFVRTKLREIKSGKVVDHTFTAGVKIEPVRIENREHQYLYNDDQGYHFMNTDNYEQIFVPAAQVPTPGFLKEGENAMILFHADEEEILMVELKPHVVFEITYTEPGIKGDTATNTLKPATIETGAEVRVPLFINEGDKIKIDTRTGEYVERVKE